MKVIEKPVLRSRGRKAEADPVIQANLSALEVGQWAIFDEFGTVTDGKAQAKIGQKIRTQFGMLGLDGKVTVRWSPEGDAQVAIFATEDSDTDADTEDEDAEDDSEV
jgi:hypothetical protein